jgi:hypothetical protein
MNNTVFNRDLSKRINDNHANRFYTVPSSKLINNNNLINKMSNYKVAPDTHLRDLKI